MIHDENAISSTEFRHVENDFKTHLYLSDCVHQLQPQRISPCKAETTQVDSSKKKSEQSKHIKNTAALHYSDFAC